MKIALLDVNFDNSSSGKITSTLHDELIEQGHQVKSFYGRGPNVFKKNVIKISSKIEFIFHVIAARISGLLDIFSPFSTQKLIKYLDSFKPNVIHLHELHGYYLNTYKLLDYLKKKNIPIIWTFHCEYMFTGKCGFSESCNKWKLECDQCPKLREYPSSLFFDFTKLMFNKKKKILNQIQRIHFTAPTQWLAKRMLQSIIKEKPISIVPNAVDLSIFKNQKNKLLRKKLNINDDSFVVLTVGENLMSPRKGGEWVFDLAKRNLDKDIVFIMIGAYGAYNLKKKEKSYKNLKIISYIKDKKLLAKYYSAADIFLLTSVSESFSMVSAESLACGTPVIGFDSGAPKDVVQMDYGKFVKYGNIEQLNLLLNDVKSGKIKFKSSFECEEFVKQKYSKSKMVNEYLKIYKSIINDYKK